MKTIDYVKLQLKLNFGRKAEFLKSVLMYLETNPRKEFLQSEKQRLENVIEAKNKMFEYWVKNVVPTEIPEKSYRSLFNKENGITDCIRFLKTINYILTPDVVAKPKQNLKTEQTI